MIRYTSLPLATVRPQVRIGFEEVELEFFNYMYVIYLYVFNENLPFIFKFWIMGHGL